MLIQLEQRFEPKVALQWMEKYWYWSVVISLVYLGLIIVGTHTMKKRPAFQMRRGKVPRLCKLLPIYSYSTHDVEQRTGNLQHHRFCYAGTRTCAYTIWTWFLSECLQNGRIFGSTPKHLDLAVHIVQSYWVGRHTFHRTSQDSLVISTLVSSCNSFNLHLVCLLVP